ncbi:MAG: MBOAT family protein [Lachnospiraceae bacterium]|jgi:D-alanyl-lipoteichoic acid acyltransferase DltB (MBOAT superfamily)|nr:MBOAT family protein [Lachnospiraceae bacterium]
MAFNSYPFLLVFLPVSLVGEYFLQHLHRDCRWWLLATSAIFYALCGVKYLPFGTAEILVNYLLYRLIRSKPQQARKILHLSVFCNVLVLFCFKYLGFALSISNALHLTDLEIPQMLLPTGISFITFQQIAFLVDAYHNPNDKYSLLDYSVFSSFFPHITSGPIVLSKQFFPLLQNFESDWGRVSSGLILFAIGLSKKVLIADALGGGVDYAYANLDQINASSMLFASVLYTLQIYFDFSGYSDMAIGIARMLGLDLPINFNSPYRANNISEFWDRWHITLTRFLTHYVYIPLGGNRKGKLRTYLNIMIVFLVSGIWHGASFTFVLWGMTHGILTVIHKAFSKRFRLPSGIGRVITLLCVNFAWILFRAGDLHTLRSVLSLFRSGNWGALDQSMCAASLPRILVNLVPNSVPVAVTAILFATLAGLLTQLPVNSQAIAGKKKHVLLDRMIVALLFVVSLFSLSGVTHFIYAYF